MPAGLPAGLAGLVAQAGEPAKPRPVERWNPPYCGEIDMRIAADGTWLYRGSPIGRDALVRLFASILRREPDGSSRSRDAGGEGRDRGRGRAVPGRRDARGEGEGELASSPSAPMSATLLRAGPEHPIRFATEPATGGLKPYLRVRGGLEALATRSLAQDLVGDRRREGRRAGALVGRHLLRLSRTCPWLSPSPIRRRISAAASPKGCRPTAAPPAATIPSTRTSPTFL